MALVQVANSLTGAWAVEGVFAGCCALSAFACSPRARFEYQPTHVHQMLVVIGDMLTEQLQPLGAGHRLEVSSEHRVHPRVVDRLAGGCVLALRPCIGLSLLLN